MKTAFEINPNHERPLKDRALACTYPVNSHRVPELRGHIA